MEFGHATSETLDSLAFSLPPDHVLSKYPDAENDSQTQFFTGCGKWGIPEWVGPLYPPGTKEKDYLHHYIQRFNSIELNGTFYRLSRSSLESWASEAAGTHFLYCPKWSQRITHFKRLSDVEENVSYFLDAMSLLGDHLGCTFLTLPSNFSAKYLDRVLTFLQMIPDAYPIQIEFRHESWFEEPVFSQIISALKEKKIGAVITDVALRRDTLHMCLTCPVAFIRFNGYGLHSSDFTRLDEWILRLFAWKNRGLEKIYFFMHQENEAHTIVLCDYFIRKINEKFPTNLLPPGLLV